MTFDLEWRDADNALGRWSSFPDAAGLKAFVSDPATTPEALHQEFRVRSRAVGDEWECITSAASIARWFPPARPTPLLAARWTVEDAIAASQARHVQRLRACLASAQDDGLLIPTQVEAIVSIFDQAIAGEGPAGRHHDPLASRPDDIATPMEC